MKAKTVTIQTTATILIGGQYIKVPMEFKAEVKGTTEYEVNHEVYHMLKDAILGFNADYNVISD